jgi:hypothetical protein
LGKDYGCNFVQRLSLSWCENQRRLDLLQM